MMKHTSQRSADSKIQLDTTVKKIGHITKVCRSKPKVKNSKVHNLDIEKTEEKVPILYTSFSITQMEQALPPAKLECMIQRKPFIFEVDSGTPFSLMSVKMFDAVK